MMRAKYLIAYGAYDWVTSKLVSEREWRSGLAAEVAATMSTPTTTVKPERYHPFV